MPRQRFKKFIINIGLSIISIFVTLLVIETALRIFYPAILHNQGLRSYNPKTGYTFQPNLNMDIDVGKGLHKLITNEYGYIGRFFSLKKPKGEWRIANFGDSYVEGIQEVDWDKNFVSQLEKYLQDNYKKVSTTTADLNFKSLNFGVAGRGQVEEYWTYKYFASKAHPDLNIVWITIANDFSNNLIPPQSKENLEANKTGRIKYWLKKSALANLLFEYLKDNMFFIKIFNKLHVSNAIVYKEDDTSDGVDLGYKMNYSLEPKIERDQKRAYQVTEELLNNFNNLARDKKENFLVIIIPDSLNIYNQYDEFFRQYPKAKKENYDFLKAEKKLREILEKNNIAYLDLSDEFKKYAEGKSQYEDCGNLFGDHFTECGHKITTQIVGKYILENYFP